MLDAETIDRLAKVCVEAWRRGGISLVAAVDLAIRAALEAAEKRAEPIPIVIHCPECRARHIDAGEFATKPHHTHACQSCGLTWRPAVVPTVGVQFLPGFKNSRKETDGIYERRQRHVHEGDKPVEDDGPDGDQVRLSPTGSDSPVRPENASKESRDNEARGGGDVGRRGHADGIEDSGQPAATGCADSADAAATQREEPRPPAAPEVPRGCDTNSGPCACGAWHAPKVGKPIRMFAQGMWHEFPPERAPSAAPDSIIDPRQSGRRSLADIADCVRRGPGSKPAAPVVPPLRHDDLIGPGARIAPHESLLRPASAAPEQAEPPDVICEMGEWLGKNMGAICSAIGGAGPRFARLLKELHALDNRYIASWTMSQEEVMPRKPEPPPWPPHPEPLRATNPSLEAELREARESFDRERSKRRDADQHLASVIDDLGQALAEVARLKGELQWRHDVHTAAISRGKTLEDELARLRAPLSDERVNQIAGKLPVNCPPVFAVRIVLTESARAETEPLSDERVRDLIEVARRTWENSRIDVCPVIATDRAWGDVVRAVLAEAQKGRE